MTGHTVTYRCAPAIAWAKDAAQTLVVCPERQLSWSLPGPEAAIWDLLALGYSFDRLAHVLALIEGVTEEAAGRQVRAALHAWREAGLVEVVEVNVSPPS